MSIDPIFIGKWNDKSDYSEKNIFSYNKLNDNLNYIKVSDDISVPERVKDLREAAIIHKKCRKYAQDIIKPGINIYDACINIEKKIKDLSEENNLKKGIGFPIGFSINDCAAHDSAVPNDKRIIKKNDIIKIDFGTHVNGNIIDSAFTLAYDNKYNPLLSATYDATWTTIKNAGPGAYIDDLSNSIQEIIESYEIELNGKMYPIKSIINLGGHTIEPYKIHAGKLLLGGNYSPIKKRMESGECWAIETFATTGKSNLVKNGELESSHYMLNNSYKKVPLKLGISKKILGHIQKTRKTLPFCTRWMDDIFGKKYKIGLKDLVNKKIISEFPPLMSNKNSYTSQFEHTIYLHDYGKEILSYGDDY